MQSIPKFEQMCLIPCWVEFVDIREHHISVGQLVHCIVHLAETQAVHLELDLNGYTIPIA